MEPNELIPEEMNGILSDVNPDNVLADITGNGVEQQLDAALQSGDAASVEAIVEAEPAAVAEVLPDDMPLKAEAEQVADGTVQDSEVSNEAVEDAINRYNQIGGFLKQSMDPELQHPEQPIEQPVEEEPVDDGTNADMALLGITDITQAFDAPIETREQAAAKQRLVHLAKEIFPFDESMVAEVPPTTEERLSKAGLNVCTLAIPAKKEVKEETEPTEVKTGSDSAPVVEENTEVIKPGTTRFSNGSLSSGAFGLMASEYEENTEEIDEVEKFRKELEKELDVYNKGRINRWKL